MNRKCGCGNEICYDELQYDFEDLNDSGKTRFVRIVFEWCSECGYEHLYNK